MELPLNKCDKLELDCRDRVAAQENIFVCVFVYMYVCGLAFLKTLSFSPLVHIKYKHTPLVALFVGNRVIFKHFDLENTD